MSKSRRPSYLGMFPPLELSAAFGFTDTKEAAEFFANPTSGGYGYTRMGIETVTFLERALAKMEGAKEGSVWATRT